MSGNVSFPKQEEAILTYWKEIDAFHTQLKKSEAYGKEYVFYDGPPFATGLPHYGHILAGNIKDIVTRYLDLILSRTIHQCLQHSTLRRTLQQHHFCRDGLLFAPATRP